MPRMPSLFIGHGAPTLALDPAKGAPLAALGAGLSEARAVLTVSAHWEASPVTIGAVGRRPLLYDFYGFPDDLYRVTYGSPDASELAGRVAELLGRDVQRAPSRGLDHGVWTPLVHLFPRADRPVLQLSLPSAAGARGVLDLGRSLAALRDEGVLLIGSGNLTHNLRAMAADGTPPEPPIRAFDEWAAAALQAHDWDALLGAPEQAPHYRLSHPTPDHWLPLFFPLGASSREEPVTFPIDGWEYGNLSRRAVRFG